MSALKTLVLMQLKEKLNIKNKKFTNKKIIFSVIFSSLKFLLVVALCYGILYLCRYLKLFSLSNNIIPSSVITVVFTIMMLISIVSATMAINKSMYYSYDNPVLLTLPCRPTQVYLSKLIVFYIYELMRNLAFMVPLFFAYGLISGFSILYYPWVLFCFIFISMVPVLLGAILSIPMMWVYNFFRQYRRLQIASLVLLVGLSTFVVVKLISIIPSNIDIIGTWGTTFWKIQDFLSAFTQKFYAFDRLVTMLVGVKINLVNRMFTTITFTTLIYLLLVNIILFILGLVTVRPLFYKMASKPFEYRKIENKVKSNISLTKRASIFKTEMLLNLRSPEKIFTNVGLLIAMPVLIFFLNKMFAAMNTRMLGNNMAISFNMLIILLISLSSSYYAASVFSKDGRSSYLIKVQPSRYQPLLIAKLVFNTMFMVIAYFITFFVLISNTGLGIIKSLILILSALFIYLAHLFYSAELDIMNPQNEVYATMGNNDNNPNETKSTIMAFFGAFITFGVLLFLLIENNGIITYLKILILGLVIMLFRLYMLLNKIKLYYKEK